MTKRLTALLVLSFAILPSTAIPSKASENLRGFPLAIICEIGSTIKIGYLSTVKSDGSAVYVSADARLAANVTADGTITPAEIANPPSDGIQPSTCENGAMDDLRQRGMVIEVE